MGEAVGRWRRPLPTKSSDRATSTVVASPDAAVSEVVGSLLLAAITVTLAVAAGQTMLGAVPEPDPPPVTFAIDLAAGEDGWASGDETLSLAHTGGAALPRGEATIRVTVGSENRVYGGEELGGAFDDGELTIGETWSTNLTVPTATSVDVHVVRSQPSRSVVASAQFTSGSQTCADDTQAPTVAVWSQEPDPLTATTSGRAEVTATVEDDCSGVDVDDAPTLAYRIDDADLTVAENGTLVGQRTWQASIPEPADGWQAHAGGTLTYRWQDLADQAGNTAPSENRSVPIEDESGAGHLTYVTDHTVFSGTLEGFAAAQNASDDGDTALLTENATSPGNTSSEAYATAHSSASGTEDAGDATGSPDDAHARVDAKKEWVAVEGFQTFSGDILGVELAFQATDEGGDAPDDELELSYKVGHRHGDTRQRYAASELGPSTDNETVYLDVTGDRDWAWTDVDDLQVRATYEANGGPDDVVYAVDALWVRVTYEDPSYNMSIRGDIEGLPEGDHALELGYAVSDERHHVQIWNATASQWEQRGSALTSSSLRDWSLDLAPDEVAGNETRFRIVDDGGDSVSRSTVELDYARGRTR